MNTQRAWRMRVLAVASGLLAVTATVTPAAVAGEAGSDQGRASAAQLAAADDRVLAADVAGTAWYVDGESGRLVVTVDRTVSAAEVVEIRRAAGVPDGALEISRMPGTLAPRVAGGETIIVKGLRCTIAFNVQDSAGVKYALTAGHCTRAGDVTPIGTTVGSSFPGNDYALIRYANQADADGRVYLYNGTYRDITGAGNPFVGQSVQRSGGTSGVHGGSVTGLNATVNYGADGIVTGMIQTNLCAEPGDSGGPLFSGNTALGIISGGSGNCSSGGVTFAQPVVEALNAYSVSVF